MNNQSIRVLLNLDCDSPDVDTLRALSALANEHQLELTGLFVEDEDVLKAASLPGLTEISLVTGKATKLSEEHIRKEISSQARRAKARFEDSVKQFNYRSSFKIARGRALDIVAESALSSDVLVISRSLRTFGMRSRHGSQFEGLVSQHNNILFVNEPWNSGKCIILLMEYMPEESSSSTATVSEKLKLEFGNALNIARRFADTERLELLVAMPQEGLTDIPDGLERADRLTVVDNWSEQTITRLCDQENARLLVIPSNVSLDWRALLVRLVDRLSCSLLRVDG